MAKKINRIISEGKTQPKIRAGEKWRDSRGEIVTVKTTLFNRVVFYRKGYEFPCAQPEQRFIREFRPVEGK